MQKKKPATLSLMSMNCANQRLSARLLSLCAIALLTAVFFTPAATTQEAGKLINVEEKLKTVDTTDQQDASFQKSGDQYAITARGGFYKEGEAFGAIYVPDVFKSRMAVEVTLEQQENVRQWTKTGLKIASDMTAAGESPGDLLLYATPKHGYMMALDKNRDGSVQVVAKANVETTYPVTFRLERNGAFATGYYSTDGGESFSKVGTAKLPKPDDAMDVGMVQASSKPNEPGKSVFSNFRIRNTATINRVTKPDPLPEGAEPLDRIIFGNKPSEQNHEFSAESSWLTRGQYGKVSRQIQRVIPEKDVPYEWTIGSMSFNMKVDPEERNFLTLKLQQDTAPFDPAPMAIFYGDEQIGYMNGREGYSTPGSFYGGGPQTGDWVYVTSVLPKSVTEGKESVRLRVAAYDPHGGPMSGYIGTDIPVYRAYTHIDSLFTFPSDEDPFKRQLGSPGGDGEAGDIDDAMAEVKSNVEASIKHGLQKDQVGELVAEFLARATKRDWIETMDEDRVYELVRDTIDRHLRTWEKQDRKMIHQGCWRCNGNLARAFTIMADEFKKRDALQEPIPNSPNDDPREKVYTDFFVDAYQSRQNDRNVIANQVQIVTNAVIANAHALEILNPDRAPLDMKVQGWIDQLIGVEPLTKLPGETGGAGPNWRSPAYFQWSDGRYTIRSGGGFYKNGEAYGAIYTPDAFESGMSVEATLEHQQKTDEWAKTGIKLASDMTKAGTSVGDLVLYAIPEHGYMMAVDKKQDGTVEVVAKAQSKASYPVTFKLERDGAAVTGYYSTDGGDSFKKVGSTELPKPDDAMDVGIVQAGNKSNNPGKVVYSGFRIARDGETFEPKTRPQPIATAEEINASSDGNSSLKVVDTTKRGGRNFTLSKAGLNREIRYASGHGEIPNLIMSKLAQDVDQDVVDERLLDHIEAMGWFRWRGAEGGRREVIQNGFLSARNTRWPGDTGLWVQFTRAPAILGAVDEPTEMVKRWAEYMVEVDADFTLYPNVNKRLTRLNNMMPMYDGLKRLKQLEPSTYKLPWERERAVWGDPDQGMVSITDGNVRIQACLGMNHGTYISDTAKFGYLGPDGHRVGTVKLRRKEFPLHRMVKRPNSIVTFKRGVDYSTGGTHDTPYYMPWHGERRQLNLYRRGQKVPLAGRPGGGAWPLANNYPEKHNRADFNVGYLYYYREARIGPYLIGINSTGAPKRAAGPAKTYEMNVPTDEAINVRTGEPVDDDSVTVGPRETVVIKLEE